MNRVKCDYPLCIYWRDGACRLDVISIDSDGLCADCIRVSLEEEDLEWRRESLLRAYGEDLTASHRYRFFRRTARQNGTRGAGKP